MNDINDMNKRFLVPIITGFIIWILAFFIVGYTQMPDGPEELYLPMVFLSTIIWLILIIFVFRWYCNKYGLKNEWFREAILFGLIISILQFIFDIIAFMGMMGYTLTEFIDDYLLKSTVLILYPLIIAEVTLIAFLLNKYEII